MCNHRHDRSIRAQCRRKSRLKLTDGLCSVMYSCLLSCYPREPLPLGGESNHHEASRWLHEAGRDAEGDRGRTSGSEERHGQGGRLRVRLCSFSVASSVLRVGSSTSYLIHHALYLMPYTSCLIPHISYLRVGSSTSYLIHHTLYLMPYTSCLIPHALYLIYHTSYLIYHTSYLIYHTSYLIPYALYPTQRIV